MLSLVNAAQVLTSTLDINQVLEKLMSEVLNVIDGADAGVLFMLNTRTNRLIAKHAIGYNLAHLKKIHLASNEGMTGKVFSQKKAFRFHSSDDVTESMSDLFPLYEEDYTKAVGNFAYPKSAVCAPLLDKSNTCIGVLTIVNFSGDTQFENNDLMMLQAFANQSSIAIENAKLFTQNERSKRIYDALTRVSLTRGRLSDMTDTLASLLGQPVAIMTDFHDVLVASSPIAKHAAEFLVEQQLEHLNTVVQQCVQYQVHITIDQDMYVNYLFPIHTERGVIGMLLIVMHNHLQMDPLDLFAVEQASALFALQLAEQEKELEISFKYDGYLLQQLLNLDFTGFYKRQEALQTTHFLCATLQLQENTYGVVQTKKQQQQFSKLLYRATRLFSFPIFISEHDFHYQFLFLNNLQVPVEQFKEHIQQFFELIDKDVNIYNSLSFHVGLGRVFESIENITSSHRDSKKCIDYLQTLEQAPLILSYEKLGPYTLFLNNDPQEMAEYIALKLGPIIKYDNHHKTDLLYTLKLYFLHNQSRKHTAEACFVHINTIKYRLQTIFSLLDVNEKNGQIMFELNLALYMQSYLQNAKLAKTDK
ncbi:helix-turn-helix domain-containing protein [Lysinibacillus sp. NPDC097287]|uniref:helix-turn-helix domain-containing protein n=1 Tax=Lysinibacillus sp. NPDC097287 TaxID=3364144 RepID=UPI0037F302E7